MSSAARRSGGGLLEGLYRAFMRRDSIHVAFLSDHAVDYGAHRPWEMNNVGEWFEDISVLGQRPAEE